MLKARDHEHVLHKVLFWNERVGVEPDGFDCDDVTFVCCKLGEVEAKFVDNENQRRIDVAALQVDATAAVTEASKAVVGAVPSDDLSLEEVLEVVPRSPMNVPMAVLMTSPHYDYGLQACYEDPCRHSPRLSWRTPCRSSSRLRG